jgi:hypothetical protein
MPIMPHPQPYTVGWLRQGSDLCVRKQCHLLYGINPLKYDLLCDFDPLKLFDVLFGQTYLWKFHSVYESRPCSVIITLYRKLYRIPQVVPPSAISFISTKKCRKVTYQIEKFVFFVIYSQSERKVAATSMVSVTGLFSIRSWKNTKTYSHHLLGYLCTIRSSIQSILPPMHRYPMGQSISSLF